MNGLAQYILTVVAAAMLVGILQSLAGQGTMGTITKLLGGVFLALTMLSPVLTLEIPDPAEWFSDVVMDGESMAAEGMAMAADAKEDIIRSQVEAYILDKAGADLAVAVELDAAGVPCGVTLTGDISPRTKAQLSRMLAEDLGLGEEVQQWYSKSGVPG